MSLWAVQAWAVIVLMAMFLHSHIAMRRLMKATGDRIDWCEHRIHTLLRQAQDAERRGEQQAHQISDLEKGLFMRQPFR